MFLVGAMSDQVRADLGVGEAAIGAAVTSLFVVAAVAATTIGRVTERLGAARAMRAGVLLAGLLTAGTGLLPGGYALLLGLTAAAGLAVCLVDTGAAAAFADHVPPHRQGTAFGIKEAAIPGASLLAGAALPTVAAQTGWRTVFVVAVSLPVVLLLTLPRAGRRAAGRPGRADPARGTAPPGRAADAAAPHPAAAIATMPPPSGTPSRDRTTVVFAVGVAFGTAAATAAATFLVPALTATGVATAAAGTVLAVASLASIAARLAIGRWADRPGARPARAVAGMLALGSVGAGVLAAGAPLPTAVSVAGAVLLLAAGWGWTGLAFLAVVRARPGAAAAAAGVVLTGLSAGGAAGPVAFGALADGGTYALAWSVAALALLIGAAATGRAATALDRAGV